MAKRKQKMTKGNAFKSNIEYLSASLDLLKIQLHVRGGEKHALKQERHGHSKTGDWTVAGAAKCRDELADCRKTLAARVAATIAEGKVELPLESLATEFELDDFEKQCLLMVLGPSLDPEFDEVVHDVTKVHGCEIRVLLEILCPDVPSRIKARKYFVHDGKLLGNGLLALSFGRYPNSEMDFLRMDVEIPRRVSSLILGEYDIDDQVAAFSSIVEPTVKLDQVVLPDGVREEVLQLIAERERLLETRRDWGLDDVIHYGRGTVLMFSGPSGTGKTLLANGLANHTGQRLMCVDFEKVKEHSRGGFEENLQRVFHEARLQRAIIFFDEADELFGDRCMNGAMPILLREFEKYDGLAILATNRKQVLDEAMERRILYKLDFEIPAAPLREEIWRKHLPETVPMASDVNLGELGEKFEFSGGYVKNAVQLAVTHALRRNDDKPAIRQEDLLYGAKLQRRNRLERFTDKVVPKVGLPDVVLPDALKAGIREMVTAVRNRHVVFRDWGFGEKLSLGRAVTALFHGPSGVGKTMAAEAVAFELGRPLYPIDLSTVVSKYVGQTQANLKQIFDAARETESVLFCDECDALFSARVQDGGHHARYINQEVNALLTAIESFDGVVLLATNHAGRLDPAFERRLRFRFQFEAPDAAAREAIWRGMIPDAAPLADDVDFAALAREYAFTGGTIRNVVLRAAYAAAMNDGQLTQELLCRCADEDQPLQKRKQPVGFHAA